MVDEKNTTQSLEFAESIINTVREPLISLDQDLRVVTANRSFYKFFKVKPEETVGKLIYDLGNRQWDIPKLRQLLETILPQKTVFDDYEVEHDFATIGRRVMLLNARQILRGMGKERIILLAIEDITEHKRLENELAESEERYRRLFETANDGILLLEKHGMTIHQANPAITTMLGYPCNECIGKEMKDIGFPSDIGISQEIMQTLNREGIIHYNDVLIHSKDGRVVDADIYMVDKTNLIQCNIRDITESKKTDEKIRRDEARLRRLVDILQHSSETIQKFLDYALKQAIQLTESKIGFIYHYNEVRKEFVLNSWSKDVLPECAVTQPQTCYELAKTGLWGEVVRQRQPIIVNDFQSTNPLKKGTPSGHVQLFKYMSIPIFKGENIVGVVSLANKKSDYDQTDILQVSLLMDSVWKVIDRMHAEEENKKINLQFQQAQKMESIGRLAGGVAHDFNNMLSVILGYGQMAVEMTQPKTLLHEYAQEIVTAAVRSANITRQLLAFARKQVITPKVINLNDIMEDMLKMLRRLIGEDINLRWLPTSVWPVNIDSSQLDQILANVCVNARDAISGVGNITIETATKSFDEAYCSEHFGFIPGDFTLFSISDDGCGMDKDVQNNIFEPFFTTKEVGKGTGLGLATVYGIVKQNNGFINVYSEPGKGTTFRIYLPRHREQGDKEEQQREETIRRGHGENVLVVEDEISILKLAAQILKNLGYVVVTANSPKNAINLVKKHSETIDLVITDVIMPEMNGRDLANLLLTIHPNMKCLFMSGYTSTVIADQGVLAEGIQFIQKPFSAKELGAKVHEVLKGKKDNPP